MEHDVVLAVDAAGGRPLHELGHEVGARRVLRFPDLGDDRDRRNGGPGLDVRRRVFRRRGVALQEIGVEAAVERAAPHAEDNTRFRHGAGRYTIRHRRRLQAAYGSIVR